MWYSFLYFGHNKELVYILNGGLEKWNNEKLVTTNIKTNLVKTKYSAIENNEMVKNLDEINDNIEEKKFKLVDARSIDRLEGRIAEPREGLRSGSIKNSICLPFKEVINKDNTFKSLEQLKIIFDGVIKGSDKDAS